MKIPSLSTILAGSLVAANLIGSPVQRLLDLHPQDTDMLVVVPDMRALQDGYYASALGQHFDREWVDSLFQLIELESGMSLEGLGQAEEGPLVLSVFGLTGLMREDEGFGMAVTWNFKGGRDLWIEKLEALAEELEFSIEYTDFDGEEVASLMVPRARDSDPKIEFVLLDGAAVMTVSDLGAGPFVDRFTGKGVPLPLDWFPVNLNLAAYEEGQLYVVMKVEPIFRELGNMMRHLLVDTEIGAEGLVEAMAFDGLRTLAFGVTFEGEEMRSLSSLDYNKAKGLGKLFEFHSLGSNVLEPMPVGAVASTQVGYELSGTLNEIERMVEAGFPAEFSQYVAAAAGFGGALGIDIRASVKESFGSVVGIYEFASLNETEEGELPINDQVFVFDLKPNQTLEALIQLLLQSFPDATMFVDSEMADNIPAQVVRLNRFAPMPDDSPSVYAWAFAENKLLLGLGTSEPHFRFPSILSPGEATPRDRTIRSYLSLIGPKDFVATGYVDYGGQLGNTFETIANEIEFSNEESEKLWSVVMGKLETIPFQAVSASWYEGEVLESIGYIFGSETQ
ncbi:MAG: hypothetical protein ACFCU4_11045 [Puniceicoccaceae bacterium]